MRRCAMCRCGVPLLQERRKKELWLRRCPAARCCSAVRCSDICCLLPCCLMAAFCIWVSAFSASFLFLPLKIAVNVFHSSPHSRTAHSHRRPHTDRRQQNARDARIARMRDARVARFVAIRGPWARGPIQVIGRACFYMPLNQTCASYSLQVNNDTRNVIVEIPALTWAEREKLRHRHVRFRSCFHQRQLNQRLSRRRRSRGAGR